VHRLTRVLAALDARIQLRVLWHGEELDRLLDAEHAQLVELFSSLLSAAGWATHLEATFQIRGERGSIDILAIHRDTGAVLVVEVKSVVPDLQSMLSSLDRKVRLAPVLLRERGIAGRPDAGVSRLVVLPDDRTARRRVARFESTFAQTLPARTVEVRRWLKAPVGPLAGVVFLSGVTHAGGRQRIRSGGGRRDHGPASSS
jgi:hypothetical protein